MRSPMGPRGLEVFRLTASHKQRCEGVRNVLQGANACINPTWGLLPVRVELLGSPPYQGERGDQREGQCPKSDDHPQATGGCGGNGVVC